MFFVHNRVHDIEEIQIKIRSLVPEATIIIAHGQLPESELEKRITDFYLGKFQILICTTIIETGLDIPNANTMIIDPADSYGLSQLHQLRGRIGRSERKAYAYLLIPKNKILHDVAESRLKALQTYAGLGAGFSIASCDLEIRGAGDILGAEQSGHLQEVGLEIYLELLKDAINEIKGKVRFKLLLPEIHLPFPATIPESYIEENSKRLKYLKLLSQAENVEQLNQLFDTIKDQFGEFTDSIINLKIILECRLRLATFAIISVHVAHSSMILTLDHQILDKDQSFRDRLVEYFCSKPKNYRLDPDFKVTYVHKVPITPSIFLEIITFFTENLAGAKIFDYND